MSITYDSGGGIGGNRINRLEREECTLRIYPGVISEDTIYCPVLAQRGTTAAEVIQTLIEKLHLERGTCYVLAEVKESGGEEWILNPTDCPAQRMLLWPRRALDEQCQPMKSREDYRFLLREKNMDGSIRYEGPLDSWMKVTEERRRMVERGFLPQPLQQDYDDLCRLPDLNERTLLDNLRVRFKQEKIYTYVGTILIAVNPFKFLPIYNPKYVQLYDNHELGKQEPHIFAVADTTYHAMLRQKTNQCIVISGESGSGKTQSTNFLIHHLTALSQKGYASGVEQTILGAGPVLEAFGNAKTAHNNNSSRFGKFIQVNYWENGIVRGAVVEKYLLEKSRLVSQETKERNYHVFYYLLAGATQEEQDEFQLKQPEEYQYLNQPDGCFTEGEDLKHDFKRLQLAMEMVGFLPATRKRIFMLLSAILHLGNISYKKKPYRDEAVEVATPDVLSILSNLLQVKEEMLTEALTTRKTMTAGEKLILPYKLTEAVTARDSMAKSLYSALFDWIVLRINHALLYKMERSEHVKGLSIGVLDIFGFEDFENNSFEQFCINYANECLQYYFNQHVFKIEQEEYQKEGILWNTIDYTDNLGCINLISKKPTGLLHLLDEECNFPQATNETLLAKFRRQHDGNKYYESTAVMEPAFIIKHYAGRVKYCIKDFREKNTDHMRPDIVALLRSSESAFVRSLISIDPVAVFRWAVLRAFFRAAWALRALGKNATESSKPGKGTPTRVRSRGSALVKAFRLAFQMHKFTFQSLFIPEESDELCSLAVLAVFSVHTDAVFKGKNVKSRQSIPKHLLDVNSLKHIVNLTLHDRTTKSLLHLNKKKKPPSISAQFQTSLNKLMETLDHADPFFIRCIRSNADKMPLRFDEKVVLRQLRYTGMLETVRIRQAGYSVRYSFKQFAQVFYVLMPHNSGESKENITNFLNTMRLNPGNFQIGHAKVFMKESERQTLAAALHTAVLSRITLIQGWFRAALERRRFLRARQAASTIQACWRRYRLCWRIVRLQAACRGFVARKRYKMLLEQNKKEDIKRQHNTDRVKASQEKWTKRLETRNAQTEDDRKHLEKTLGTTTPEDEGRLFAKGGSSTELTDKVVDPSRDDLLRASSSSSIEDENVGESKTAVSMRDRPKSLPLEKQSQVRAKRLSRRQRELEQADYSLGYARQRSGDTLPSVTPTSEGETFPTSDIPTPTSPPSASKRSASSDQLSPSRILSRAGFRKDVDTIAPEQKAGEVAVRGMSAASSPVTPSKLVLGTPDSESSSKFDITEQSIGQAEKTSSPTPYEEQRDIGKQSTRSPTSALSRIKQDGHKEGLKMETPSTADAPKASASADTSVRSPEDKVFDEGRPTTNLLQKLEERNRAMQGKQQKRQQDKDEHQMMTLIRQQREALKSERLDLERREWHEHGGAKSEDLTKPTAEQRPPQPPAPAAPVQPKVQRRKSIKISNLLSSSAQSKHSDAQVISSHDNLKQMIGFLQGKINDLLPDDGKNIDGIFKEALKEFRKNLEQTNTRYNEDICMRHKDLISNFEQVLDKTVRQRPYVTDKMQINNVCINLFSGFMVQFMGKCQALDDSNVTKLTRPCLRLCCPLDQVVEHNGHQFRTVQFNIPSFCEACATRIWIMDRGYVCRACKFACHKKCYSSTTRRCTGYYNANKKAGGDMTGKQFAVDLFRLTGPDRSVPFLLEKLLNYIEIHGLYTEGIYRKSGANTKVKELRQQLDNDVNSVNLDDYQVHVIGSVLKQWLRELPVPLMTFDLYDEFLRAVSVQEKKEKIKAVYSIIGQLPSVNYSTLERIIFHLVRSSTYEDTNRMSCNALAIVFAPCILRPPDTTDPLQSMRDIGQTTHCVELLVEEQMRKFKTRFADISTLESVENSANQRLSLIRRSMPGGTAGGTSVGDKIAEEGESDCATEASETNDLDESTMEEEEQLLSQEKETIKERLSELRNTMISLERSASDDDALDSSSRDTIDGTDEPSKRDHGHAEFHWTNMFRRKKRLNKGSMRQESTDSATTSDGESLSGRLHPSVAEYRAHGVDGEGRRIATLAPGGSGDATEGRFPGSKPAAAVAVNLRQPPSKHVTRSTFQPPDPKLNGRK
ncbi:unnamed protein product [Lampetra planeri]